jgi:hypothetical protein
MRVPPRKPGTGRSRDESPAIVPLDFGALFSFDSCPDLGIVQVMRIDPETGRPFGYGRFREGQHAGAAEYHRVLRAPSTRNPTPICRR